MKVPLLVGICLLHMQVTFIREPVPFAGSTLQIMLTNENDTYSKYVELTRDTRKWTAGKNNSALWSLFVALN